jgi:hypothetical protein
VISLVPRAGEGMSVVCLFVYKYLMEVTDSVASNS